MLTVILWIVVCIGGIFSAYLGLFMGIMATDAPDTPHAVGVAVGLVVFVVCALLTCGIPLWFMMK